MHRIHKDGLEIVHWQTQWAAIALLYHYVTISLCFLYLSCVMIGQISSPLPILVISVNDSEDGTIEAFDGAQTTTLPNPSA